MPYLILNFYTGLILVRVQHSMPWRVCIQVLIRFYCFFRLLRKSLHFCDVKIIVFVTLQRRSKIVFDWIFGTILAFLSNPFFMHFPIEGAFPFFRDFLAACKILCGPDTALCAVSFLYIADECDVTGLWRNVPPFSPHLKCHRFNKPVYCPCGYLLLLGYIYR